MFTDFSYRAVLASSHRVSRPIEDIIGPGHSLDFSRPFLPEAIGCGDSVLLTTKGE